jgi:tight adherence protein B
MLIQMPAAKLVNYSILFGAAMAVAMFFISAPNANGFNWKFGLVMAVIAFFGIQLAARMSMRFLKKQRLYKFNDQLEEGLMSMGNALKAGFSINQALEMVVKQKKNPISLEFKLMIQQTQLGVSFDDALRNMAKRVESEDFDLVVGAIITARQTGGDLTGVFERLGEVIRERLRIQRRIRTLTAQGRLQGLVLGGLPLILLSILYFFVDKQIIRNFFTHPIGIAAAVAVGILEICGFLTIRKIVNIDI